MYYYLLQPLLRYYDVTDRSPHNKMALIVTLIYLSKNPSIFLHKRAHIVPCKNPALSKYPVHKNYYMQLVLRLAS